MEGDIQQRFSYDDFVTRNRDILEDAADDASRTRQVAQTVGDEDLFDFYNAIIPNTVTSRGRFGEMVEDEATTSSPICWISIRTRWSVSPAPIRCPWTTIPTIGIRSAPTAPPSI